VGWVTGLAVYAVIWWLVVFMVLPWGNRPLDPEDVTVAARRLIELGCEAVGIVFINSYTNNTNELAALEAVRAVWPNEYVNASSLILPEIREFERASTTALNVCLQPILAPYLGGLQDRLGEAGSKADLLIVQSNGGVMSAETAGRLPVRTALSGPAAGVRSILLPCRAVQSPLKGS